jgi:hypothetical protein
MLISRGRCGPDSSAAKHTGNSSANFASAATACRFRSALVGLISISCPRLVVVADHTERRPGAGQVPRRNLNGPQSRRGKKVPSRSHFNGGRTRTWPALSSSSMLLDMNDGAWTGQRARTPWCHDPVTARTASLIFATAKWSIVPSPHAGDSESRPRPRRRR